MRCKRTDFVADTGRRIGLSHLKKEQALSARLRRYISQILAMETKKPPDAAANLLKSLASPTGVEPVFSP